jgi:hypothetical protein
MCEAHTHFSWNDAATLAAIQTMPLEEHVLWCAKVAKRYLEAGFTSCVGAACAKPRLDVVHPQRDQLGPDPGSALPCGEPGDHGAGGLGDETCRTCRSRVQLRRQRQLGRRDEQGRCACS